MRALRFIRQHPLTLLAVSLLGFVVWAVGLYPELFRLQRYDTIIYVQGFSALIIVLACVVAVGVVISIVLYGFKKRDWLAGAVLGFGVGATMIAFLSFVSPGASQSPMRHLARVQLGAHGYNLAHSPDAPYDVILYECDRLSILCRVVHRNWVSEFSGNVTEARLLTDVDTDTISLEIDGEVVYTHQVG